MLLQQFHALLDRGWRLAFPQARTHERAIEHAIASVCVFGRRTISRSLGALGRQHFDDHAELVGAGQFNFIKKFKGFGFDALGHTNEHFVRFTLVFIQRIFLPVAP